MGNPKYSEAAKPATVSDKFVAWLNAIDFKNDAQMTVALFEIRDEVQNRLAAMDEEKDIIQTEAEGS